MTDVAHTDVLSLVEALLMTEMLSRDGFFNGVDVQKAWQQYLQCKRQYGCRLWSILMFQS